MYILSKDNTLCYFLAKTRVIGIYNSINALLVNKSEAVQICKFHSNGSLPYGKLKNLLFPLLFYFFKIEVNWKYFNQKTSLRSGPGLEQVWIMKLETFYPITMEVWLCQTTTLLIHLIFWLSLLPGKMLVNVITFLYTAIAMKSSPDKNARQNS